jgi:type IV pilus assembly protein PilV
MHKPKSQTFRSSSAQCGFTLLEVLISIVILSIGLLGLAGLQASSLRANQSVLHSTHANHLAYDMLDRMRANRATALQGAYTIKIGDPLPAASSQPGRDIRRWNELIGQLLPQNTADNQNPRSFGSVSIDGDDVVQVTIQWFHRSTSRDIESDDDDDESEEAVEDQIRQITLSAQL